MKSVRKKSRRRKTRRRAAIVDGLVRIDDVIAERVENVLRPIEAASFAQVAAALAGPGATDAQIMALFGRAWLIVASARKWLDEDDANRDAELEKLLRKKAEAGDAMLPWSDQRLHEVAGYEGRVKDHVKTGQLLWDALDQRVKRCLGAESLAKLRNRYRKGMPLELFKKLWAATGRRSVMGSRTNTD